MADLQARFGLGGQLALVTGSTAGIGYAIAKLFVIAGAKVIVNGRTTEGVDKVVQELNGIGPGSAVPAVADISTAEGSNALISITNSYGPLDILVNNMGIFGVKDFFELTDEDWQRYFEVNVMSTVRMSRAFLKQMLERNSGRVITISSEAGVRGFPTMAQYGMTKSAQLSISRSMAGLTAGTNVTVNCVLPGPTWTEGVEKYMEGVAEQHKIDINTAIANYFKFHEPTSLKKKFLEPDEIANAVLFVASPGNSGMNGSCVYVEGGIVQKIL
eukprot:c2078_g1_i1.p1 GENE.c2078_g1_i1~~c2078_g1_i1.p1  ORF type:complete len:288 (+),score=73.42 c2078_g1_i1:49-864(+)